MALHEREEALRAHVGRHVETGLALRLLDLGELLLAEEQHLHLEHELGNVGLFLIALLRLHQRLLVRAELLLDLGLDDLQVLQELHLRAHVGWRERISGPCRRG